MTRVQTTGTSLLAALLLAGCMRGNVDLLEGRLRDQGAYLAELQAELDRTQRELEVSRQESDALRGQLAGRGEATLLPEQADVLYRASGVRFNSLLTSGLDRDGEPGHELLTVFVAPHDRDGGLLKLPGDLELKVIDPAAPADAQQLGLWSFEAAELRDHWRRGLIGSGYQLDLPWQQPPENAELVLHARFTTTDGRVFDASQMIEIEPPGGSAAPADTLELTGHSVAPEARAARFHPVNERTIEPTLARPRRIDTSDNFTDATIPRYR